MKKPASKEAQRLILTPDQLISQLRKKLLLSAVFFITTPVFLLFCVLYCSFLLIGSKTNFSSSTNAVAYAALPTAENIVAANIEQKDVRIENVRSFFHRYGSPLEPYADTVVAAADTYGIDYRLIPAIAAQESGLCQKAPKDSYNCWGYGIYDKKVMKFSSYADGIETVTKSLAHNYKNQGLDTPEEIMSKYTPSSSGTWAQSVNYFLAQLQ